MAGRAPRRRHSGPTISDVARAAGVSDMTVSRVINGVGNVRESTRKAVNKAISELHYAPNQAAQSLAGGGQCRIGVLYSNPSAGFLTEFMVGGLDQASRSNTQLVLEKCEIGEHEVEPAKRLINSGIDGMILPPPLCERADILAVLYEANIPTVALASNAELKNCLAIAIDDRRAAYDMTEHIIKLGHKRIGFITGDPSISSSSLRLEGYRQALAAHNIAWDEALIVDGRFSYRSGLIAADRLLSLRPRPTAIFASNDDMAAAVVAVGHRQGIDIPRELTVCGFDDTALSTAIWPELTTIRQPIADMSREAVNMLVSTIRQTSNAPASPIGHHVMAFTLIQRDSDAAPPPSA